MKVYLGLGSNLGEREGNILRAVELMDKALGFRHNALSSMFENPASGFEGPDFVNAVLEYETEPEDVTGFAVRLLEVCKQTEKELGRGEHRLFDEGGRRVYMSRTIDIDILLVGESRIDLPQLKVPHPLMGERDFVMVPLREFDGAVRLYEAASARKH